MKIAIIILLLIAGCNVPMLSPDTQAKQTTTLGDDAIQKIGEQVGQQVRNALSADESTQFGLLNMSGGTMAAIAACALVLIFLYASGSQILNYYATRRAVRQVVDKPQTESKK